MADLTLKIGSLELRNPVLTGLGYLRLGDTSTPSWWTSRSSGRSW